MSEAEWPRRLFLAGSAGLGLSACSPHIGRPLVTVNLTEPAVPPAARTDAGARLDTALDEARRMTVPVRVNGHGPYQFVVDTGANCSVISTQIADHLRLPAAGAARVHGIAGVEPANLFKVGRMQVGGAYASGLELPGLPEAKLGADGLLGVDVMRNRRVTMNFVANAFEIGASQLGATMGPMRGSRLADPSPQVIIVPARYRFGQLVIVGAEVAGSPVSAFLDSGAQISVGNLALRDAVLKQRPDMAARLVDVPLLSATGQTAAGQMAHLPPLRLGGLRIQSLTAVFADLHIFKLWELQDRPAILIGIDVLRQFERVILDFGHREVIFEASPAGRANPNPPGRVY
jgi:predicted aspartyl protease